MRKFTFIAVLCVLCHALIAQDVHTKVNQDLIKQTNGTSFFTEIQSVKDGIVTYQKGPQTMTLPLTEVAFIEFKNSGVEYFNKSSLQTIDPESVGIPVFQKGNKVYIPFSSIMVAQRSGAHRLRELVADDKTWEVVDCEEEAHFILEFVYSEEGKDHAMVNLKDRKGELVYQTPKSKKSDWDEVDKGIEMAEDLVGKLYDYYDDYYALKSPRTKCLFIRPEVGVGYGHNFWGFGISIYELVMTKYSLTIAKQFNPYVVFGGGISFNYAFSKYNYAYLGGFVNFRVNFRDRVFTPFIDTKVGLAYGHGPFEEERTGGKYGEYRIFVTNDFVSQNEVSFGLQYKLFDISVSGGIDVTLRGKDDCVVWGSVNVSYNIPLKKKK